MNINNNQFELKPMNSKRKLAATCPNVYLNPALDLLVNEDPMCNTKMEIVPKKRKRTKSCEIAAFENTGLDLGRSKAAVNEFLVRELDNVRKNVRIENIDHNIKVNVKHDKKIDNTFDIKIDSDIGDKIHRNSTYEVDSNINSPTGLQTDLPSIDDALESISARNVNSRLSNKTCDIHANSVIPPILFPRSDKSKNSKLPNICLNISRFDSGPIYANVSEIPLKYNDSDIFEVKNINENNSKEIGSNIVNSTEWVHYKNNSVDDIIDNNIQSEPIYANLTQASNNFRSQVETITNNETLDASIPNISDIDSGVLDLEQKYCPMNDINISAITNVQTTVTNQYFVNNSNLSFIDKLALDSPNTSNQSLYLDDDLNESNIMEIKTITIITKKKRIENKNTNPFLQPNVTDGIQDENNTTNPFTNSKTEQEYNDEVLDRPIEVPIPKNIIPRQLFTETNSTISTVSESMLENYYENISCRSESPIYENLDDLEPFNKQSKILGHDVSKFSAVDIMNLNKNKQVNSSNDSTDSKKDFKHKIAKVSNKLSKKVFKTLKNTFKSDKVVVDTTLNPYEVPRKPPKQKGFVKESGIENPALHLDNSDEIEIKELEDEPEYETIKTIRNTQLNMNVTPVKERVVDNIDISNSRVTPNKKVRFDSTLNQEKVITGDSFDCDIQSPGFDSKIDKYHDELENCINERKFLQQM